MGNFSLGLTYFDQFILTDGKFGAMMQVHIQNDGPVTIPLESPANLPVSTDPIGKLLPLNL